MKEMKFILVVAIAILGLSGCGSSDTQSEPTLTPGHTVNNCPNAPKVILDNDHFDPDNFTSAVIAMALQEDCKMKLEAMVITDREGRDKSGILFDTIFKAYKQDIPIGINRTSTMQGSLNNATADAPKLDADYKGTHSNIMEFESDGLLDSQRIDSVALLCEVLTNATEKVSYVIGGKMYNLSDFLDEKEKCDGQLLASQKIKDVVIYKARTNQSGGLYKPNPAGDATINVFKKLPINVPVVIASFHHGEMRLGDEYKTTNMDSPMAFLFAVDHQYGTFGDHGLGDTAMLLYGVFGTKINGVDYAVKNKTCMNVDSIGVIDLSSPCGKQHFYLERGIPHYEDFIGQFTRALFAKPITK